MTSAQASRQLGPAAINLKNIDDVIPLADDDRECFKEIRDVLMKHGKLERFGLSLLHKHFDVYEGESLIETCDSENRVLTIQVVKDDDIQVGRAIETNWRLDIGEGTQSCPYTIRCTSSCLEINGYHDGKQRHNGGHEKVHL